MAEPLATVTATSRVERSPDADPWDAWLSTPADDAGLALPPSELDRLLARASALDRLVADAGPLGKFRADMEGALPSGTSSFTIRAEDTLVRALSLVDFSGEDLLAATPQSSPPILPPTDLPAPDDPARIAAGSAQDISSRLHDPRPAIGSEPGFASHHRPFATTDAQPG